MLPLSISTSAFAILSEAVALVPLAHSRIELDKPVEHLLSVRLGDPGALIGNGDVQMDIVPPCAKGHALPFIAELNSIGKEVGYDLLEPLRVRLEREPVTVRADALKVEGNFFLCRL